ncbi:MAG: NAD(P)/FAD-dependent oxidoreductase [Betaproteobacteria bacterium]|nr:NAD(P)/FAD-dependent oxidoreductase [Betaproteobacteria bacterium]
MAHIVIIGGGTGGLPMAYEMAELARPEDRITVVSDRARFAVRAPSPWGGAQGGGHGDVDFPIAQNLEKKGVAFTAAGAQRVHPQRNQLQLGDGSLLDYDFLVIATGPRPAFDEIEGLGPDGYTQSLCHADHLTGCSRAWQQLVADPGPIVVGAVQGASCFAPAYESVFLMEADLRRRGLREHAPVTFVTSEPYIGHLGVGGMADSRPMLECAMRERNIAWIANARVTRVEQAMMHVSEHDETGKAVNQHALPFRYSMMMPPFRGIDAVAGVDGLANRRGFIFVDEYQRNPAYPNIYAACATLASPTESSTSVPTGSHKTAYMIESMVSAAAKNIREQIDGRSPSYNAVWNPVCLADLGGPGLAFIVQQQPEPRKVNWLAEGDWVHMSRCTACDAGN